MNIKKVSQIPISFLMIITKVELMMFSSQMHTSPDFNRHWAAPLKSWETKVSLQMLKVVLQVLQVATVEVDADANADADSDATDAPSDG